MLSVQLNNTNTLSISSKSKNAAMFIPRSNMNVLKRKPFKVSNSNTFSYEILSHGIICFTIFYCTMNWNYYRNIRLKAERKVNLKGENTKRKINLKDKKANQLKWMNNVPFAFTKSRNRKWKHWLVNTITRFIRSVYGNGWSKRTHAPYVEKK